MVVEARTCTCRYRITFPNGKGYKAVQGGERGERRREGREEERGGERRREEERGERRGERRREREGRRKGKGKVVNIQYTCRYVHVHVYCALGDCLTPRPKGRLRPRELWFLIYSCTCEWFKLKWNVMSVHLT